ncbi:hypothetical protein FF38_09186 [Lucilia cuprina]|uniref:Uncharacterized protein n=1 Tax=Lucilia cuprina TaxID=7375 RepID=A0A0L0BU51_LUCCU|nr:hypothetical protein FF38_09186 [Lucilia cuprina]
MIVLLLIIDLIQGNLNSICSPTLTSNDNKAVQFCLQFLLFAIALSHILNLKPCDVVAEISIILCRHQRCDQNRPATDDGHTGYSLKTLMIQKYPITQQQTREVRDTISQNPRFDGEILRPDSDWEQINSLEKYQFNLCTDGFSNWLVNPVVTRSNIYISLRISKRKAH